MGGLEERDDSWSEARIHVMDVSSDQIARLSPA